VHHFDHSHGAVVGQTQVDQFFDHRGRTPLQLIDIDAGIEDKRGSSFRRVGSSSSRRRERFL
jgi:hypothetical protein